MKKRPLDDRSRALGWLCVHHVGLHPSSTRQKYGCCMRAPNGQLTLAGSDRTQYAQLSNIRQGFDRAGGYRRIHG
jgi:hypothetical protein